jgi:hypothetical protein
MSGRECLAKRTGPMCLRAMRASACEMLFVLLMSSYWCRSPVDEAPFSCSPQRLTQLHDGQETVHDDWHPSGTA